MQFRQEKLPYVDIFIPVFSLWCEWWKVTIGFDKGSATNRRQAIILTNNGPVQRRIYAMQGEIS